MKRDTREIPYDCPIEATLGLIGGKWKALILDHLTDGALRIRQFAKADAEGADTAASRTGKRRSGGAACVSGGAAEGGV